MQNKITAKQNYTPSSGTEVQGCTESLHSLQRTFSYYHFFSLQLSTEKRPLFCKQESSGKGHKAVKDRAYCKKTTDAVGGMAF